MLVAALGIDSAGFKHPLGLMEGATEHSAVVQALIDDLIERGLDPAVPRLFIIDGSKALAKAIRRSFGRHAPIQRCQIHKARNIMERLSPALHASVRRALRQAWELDDAAKAEKLIRNLAQHLERDAPGVSKSILEGLDEILTVSRLGLNQFDELASSHYVPHPKDVSEQCQPSGRETLSDPTVSAPAAWPGASGRRQSRPIPATPTTEMMMAAKSTTGPAPSARKCQNGGFAVNLGGRHENRAS